VEPKSPRGDLSSGGGVIAAPAYEGEGERELDLGRWRRAIVAWWWLPVAGLVAGAVIGAVVSVGGGQSYKATALISLGTPFSPGGTAVASYVTNPEAVNDIVRSESAVERAAAAAGIAPGALRGRVTTGVVGIGPTAPTGRGAQLVTVTVRNPNPQRAKQAADELAHVVISTTTSKYVATKVATFATTLRNLKVQIKSATRRIASLNTSLAAKGLTPLEQLVLVSYLDNAEQRYGQLLQAQGVAQQQLAFAQNVESAKVIQPAAAVKSVGRSRNNSILVAALIGLILGTVAAIVVDARAGSQSLASA
jgi:uncharacterized protein involved in exopolysaccharide biosynthesis